MTVTIESNAIVEAAARALRDKVGSATFAGRTNLLPLSLDDIAIAVLAAVTPLIKREAMKEEIPDFLANVARQVEYDTLERAAKVAESYTFYGEVIATDIRALKEQP